MSEGVPPPLTTRRRLGLACSAIGGSLIDPLLTAVALTAGVLGWSAIQDLREHRLPTRVVVGAITIVPLLLLLDASRSGSMGAGVGSLLLAFGTAGALGLLWLVTPGIAFGDVILFTAAVFVPARLGPEPLVILVVASILVATAMVAIRRLARPERRAIGVPFAPALLLGWILSISSMQL